MSKKIYLFIVVIFISIFSFNTSILAMNIADSANAVTRGTEAASTVTYQATKTAANATAFGSMTWTWLILAVTAVMIGALLWYYVMHNNNDNDEAIIEED